MAHHTFLLSCPNGCNSDTILRKDLEEHQKVCPLAQVKCKFYKMGCTAVMARKDQVNHNVSSLQYHFDLVIHDRSIIMSKISDMQGELAEIKRANEDLKYRLGIAEKQITAAKTQFSHNGNSEAMSIALATILTCFGILLSTLLFMYGLVHMV